MSVGPAVLLAVPGTRAAGLVSFAAVAALYALTARATRISAWYVVGFPVAGALVIYSMLRSMAVTLVRRGVTWRGTFYPLAELRRNMRLWT